MLKYLFFILIIAVLISPFPVQADFLGGPIVPCGEEDNPCKLCHLFELANNVIKFLSELVLIIAPVFILFGGIMILASAGVPDRVALGKRIITHAIIGVIIALAAWTILRTLFNTLIGGEGFPWPWDSFGC